MRVRVEGYLSVDVVVDDVYHAVGRHSKGGSRTKREGGAEVEATQRGQEEHGLKNGQGWG